MLKITNRCFGHCFCAFGYPHRENVCFSNIIIVIVCKAMIYKAIAYCDIVCSNNITLYLEERFEKLQKRSAKLAIKKDTSDGLICRLGWFPLLSRLKLNAAIFTLFIGTEPVFLKNNYSASNHDYFTRGIQARI